MIIPFDYFLNQSFGNESEYKLTTNYFIFCFAYTLFVVLSAMMIPYIKEKKIRHEISDLADRNAITFSQTKKIQNVLDQVLICKSLFTLEGIIQFIMSNLFSLGIVVCFFGIEGLVLSVMHNASYTIPMIYIFIFILILFAEFLLDEYLVSKIRKKNKTLDPNQSHRYNKNKKLLTLIMRNAGNINSLSENLSILVTEDAIEDMCEILTISNDKSNVKKKVDEKKIKKPVKKGSVEKKDGKFVAKDKRRSKKLKNLHP
jgi:hypothetical protein